jgi:hypothetical protein
MTLNEVVWRQACAIKLKSDNFLAELKHTQDASATLNEIAAQTAIVMCYASYATGDVSPLSIYEDILEQVGHLQSLVWKIQKGNLDSELQPSAKKLYESCATLKKRLRKRINTLFASPESPINEVNQIAQNVFSAAQPSCCATVCT